MDLSYCKLIGSCDRSDNYRKYSQSPDFSTKKRLKIKDSDTKLPKISNTSSTPSPFKSPYLTKSNKFKNVSLLCKNQEVLSLDVSCKRYQIPTFSPRDLIEENKRKH